jgi:hypothetical protein
MASSSSKPSTLNWKIGLAAVGAVVAIGAAATLLRRRQQREAKKPKVATRSFGGLYRNL